MWIPVSSECTAALSSFYFIAIVLFAFFFINRVAPMEQVVIKVSYDICAFYVLWCRTVE